MRLTKYFSIMFLILLLNLSRILYSLYLGNQETPLYPPYVFEIIISISIALAIYILGYLVLVEIDERNKFYAKVATIFIIGVQVGRSLLYFSGQNQIVDLLHAAFISSISAYLFFIGLLMYRGFQPSWNPAIQRMVKEMGLATMIFAPLSSIIYIYLNMLKIENQISLDFVIIGVWGIVVAKVLLHYLSRIGTVPVSGHVDDTFIAKYKISKREKEVLALILEGFTNKEIGEKLFISFTTARTHVSHIFEKTNVKSRIELVSKVLAEKG
jgi:DNA-binding CsgD family transcriptional regulator